MTARLRVRVRPAARATRLKGWMPDGTLKLEVNAPAEDGRANRVVVALLATALGVREAAVRVTRGPSSREKVIEVDGLDPEDARRRLSVALERTGGGRA